MGWGCSGFGEFFGGGLAAGGRGQAEYQDNVYGDKELGGTQVVYLSGVPFDKLGLPTDVPEYGYPAITEGIQHTLYQWFALPFIVFTGLTYAVRKNTKGKHKEEESKATREDAS